MAATMMAALAVAGCSQSAETASSTASSSAEASGTQNQEQILIMGAASTRVLNDAISAEFPVEFNNAGSSTLISQLEDGAPGDLLITADRKAMDQAVEKGLVEDPTVFATNELVLVTTNPEITDIDSLVAKANEGAAVVACDPQVPCGRVTEALVGDKNIPFASLEHSVTDTLGKVTSGEADAGFVYSTDAIAAGDKVTTIAIPGAENEKNEYPVAVTKNATHPEQAKKVMDYLTSDKFAEVLEEHGFSPVR
ncbi:molybdate ABC transporter, periplasmic molybdate-binding protein [Corynebacterium pyruviciproducens ATCC BAA-1742]|uniref:Molybdate ABC transporter, periplasmic molybdate-binding protein n=1 Tax=Corynebacterium pyruviciproducens ATCC BAA-1742 TaxID=1125779 RepID=S2ZM00_9CORY|nr:molybdate ABC transporter substrate-binding protein [Corynebacterium pyruviciproducens]EPD71012.1 molybdate ABC transporter, periplasmic molybdate-binding protein [Corynebacterium pyruviciproducens ATCC BAA-1742]